ncbi:aminotransferase class V-fold PLP-dependent enzyme [Gloeocapsa sp. PCC 73106]|uniref:aminotransferase class V-fold PLP-dependent enzyme n=1 Tax=Gloeocapsa sp. PCC 73106 TaxID=102232 RepID=UPI0002AD1891|nr:aminotransferase class V-fold PLP-dependent enzyme [Gloeocapsa sp. PCC 73106]ELR97051.1 selenocysteine lyase [Gloeocapsa sp. PCC 73106]
MISIEEHREQFSGLANKVYFNFGGQGILPDGAMQAIIDTYTSIGRMGPFSLQANAEIAQKVALLRQAIASELGVSSQDITLTENVTAGCNIVFWGIDWRPGDQILLSDCEHPGIIAIVGEIARRFGVETVIYPLQETLNQGNPLTVIKQYLQPRTRLLVLSHLLWNTGQLLPLAEIVELSHQHSIPVLADAAQSVGCLPLDLSALGIDYYAFTGHKWLCGPAGVGGLYINPKALLELEPTFIGWRGINLDSQGKPTGWKPGGLKFEVATSAYPLYEGLRCAIALHQQWGTPQQRYAQICHLSNYLWENLKQIPGIKCLKDSPPLAGLVSFQLMEENLDLVRSLEKRGFQLRTLSNPNCIRACLHYFTLESEIEALLKAIKTEVT